MLARSASPKRKDKRCFTKRMEAGRRRCNHPDITLMKGLELVNEKREWEQFFNQELSTFSSTSLTGDWNNTSPTLIHSLVLASSLDSFSGLGSSSVSHTDTFFFLSSLGKFDGCHPKWIHSGERKLLTMFGNFAFSGRRVGGREPTSSDDYERNFFLHRSPSSVPHPSLSLFRLESSRLVYLRRMDYMVPVRDREMQKGREQEETGRIVRTVSKWTHSDFLSRTN